MQKDEKYGKIKEIIEKIPGLTVAEGIDRVFHFPVYMTPELAGTNIEVLELSVRSLNSLHRVGIETIGDLCERVRCTKDLKGIRNCGETSRAEILEKLFVYQYSILSQGKQKKFLIKTLEMNANC